MTELNELGLCAESWASWQDALGEYTKRLNDESNEIAAALSEGFCPTRHGCGGRLTPVAGYAGRCVPCGTHWSYRRSCDGINFDWSCATSAFVRSKSPLVAEPLEQP